MKFKDKDGNVFEDIRAAIEHYCHNERGKCCTDETYGNCPLYSLHCLSAMENPAEAARLMGYEVVEDGERCEDRECAPPYGDKEDCDLYERGYCKAVKKEANMDKQKPYICEVLGVEVGERFAVEGFPDTNMSQIKL